MAAGAEHALRVMSLRGVYIARAEASVEARAAQAHKMR